MMREKNLLKQRQKSTTQVAGGSDSDSGYGSEDSSGSSVDSNADSDQIREKAIRKIKDEVSSSEDSGSENESS